MRSLVFALLFGLTVLPKACEPDPVDLGVFCFETLEETRTFAWQLAYGVEIEVGRVEQIHPMTERDFFSVKIIDPDRLGLVAINDSGELFFGVCKGEICGMDDFTRTFRMCRNTHGCAVIGATKNRTFYPFYSSDWENGHICR